MKQLSENPEYVVVWVSRRCGMTELGYSPDAVRYPVPNTREQAHWMRIPSDVGLSKMGVLPASNGEIMAMMQPTPWCWGLKTGYGLSYGIKFWSTWFYFIQRHLKPPGSILAQQRFTFPFLFRAFWLLICTGKWQGDCPLQSKDSDPRTEVLPVT